MPSITSADLLQHLVSQNNPVSQVGQQDPIRQQTKTFKEVLVEKASKTNEIKQVDKITTLFQGVMEGQGKLNAIIKLATSGKSFSPTELIAIQAGVYKFSQELELTSKVVEKATDGIKQTLQTQV
jgi:hypothetical protein